MSNGHTCVMWIDIYLLSDILLFDETGHKIKIYLSDLCLFFIVWSVRQMVSVFYMIL